MSSISKSAIEKERPHAQARLAAILERLHDGGAVTVTELARMFGVSDMTVRRDLAELERDGLLERVHGGAVPPSRGPLSLLDDVEPNFEARSRHNQDAKTRIADLAASIVSRHRTIAMDVGTTTFLTAQRLRDLAHIRVFTNSLRIAEEMSSTNLEVYVPGGRVRPDERSVMGPIAVEQFSQLYFDVALIGLSGLTVEGMFDYSIEDTQMKQVYLQRSAHRVVLCDSSKFRRMSLVRIGGFQDIDTLITDAPPPSDIASALAAARVDVQIAPAV
ncbi:DeoR/GlpR family DNA-binding transcription regulator [Nitratireductor pacificus]|nr:DeoR/GlpR family DNA-binding transcription regulator [Nitratireductor pacificus]